MFEPTDDFLAQQRVLVITPHPDDETYGCAGTIARIKSLGGRVSVVLVSVADCPQYKESDATCPQTVVTRETRLSEFDSVMEHLKVDDWDVLYTDSDTHLGLDAVPRKELVRLIESHGRLAIDSVEPTMLLMPAISYNQDHEAVFGACLTATRPAASHRKWMVPFVLAYDHTSLFWTGEEARMQPTFYIDVSDFVETKIEALRLHASQVRHSTYHGSPEGLGLATRVRGREVGVEAAEGFRLLRGLF